MFFGKNKDGWLDKDVEVDDPCNLLRRRNVRNTNKRVYNCGGYALNCFVWYCPLAKEDYPEDGCLNWGSSDSETREQMTQRFTAQILNDFADVRIINSLDDLLPDEYPFAFRVGKDDFHFVKRGRNKVWYEKRGSSSYINTMTEFEVFNTSWAYGRYNGRVVLFAKKY